MIDINKMYAIAEQSTIPYNRQLNNQLMTLDEATYYGRNKELIECEQILDKMVEIGHNGKTASQQFTDLMEKLSAKLATTFGFSDFHINHSMLCFLPEILLDVTSTAGCTFCKAAIIKYVRKSGIDGKQTMVVDFDKNHKGIKFKPNSYYNMRMFLGMELFMSFGEYSLTGAEILAIILHEIGHNFYVGPVRELGSTFLTFASLGDIYQIITGVIVQAILIEGISVLDDALPPDTRNAATRIINMLGTIARPVFTLINIRYFIITLIELSTVFVNMFDKIINNPITITKAFLGYDPEKYSDAFATAYGYGTELSTGLNKLSHFRIKTISNNIYSQSAVDLFVSIARLPIVFLYIFIDPHPNNQGRLLNDIRYLEAAGSKITNPYIKKEYIEELNKIKALRETTKNYAGVDPIKGADKLAAWIQDILKISDWKDFSSSLNPKRSIYKNLDIPD